MKHTLIKYYKRHTHTQNLSSGISPLYRGKNLLTKVKDLIICDWKNGVQK